LKALVLGDLGLRFLEGGGRSERFGDGFAIHFASQTQLRVVSRIIRFGAMASGFSAAAGDGANRARTQIAEAGDLAQDLGAVCF